MNVDCQRVSTEDVVERYLLDELSDADRDAFEEHYFECDQCLAELEGLRAVKVQLEKEQHSVPRLAQRPRTGVRWWWWALASAAVVTLAVTALMWWMVASTLVQNAELSPELAAMTRIDPPYYEAIRLRGVYDEAQQKYRTAMESYAAGDYAAAISGLEEAADLDPSSANISFFLGACYLLADRTPDGIAELEHTVSLGDTPFLEETYLLLAKAHIGTGEFDAARPELQAVIDLGGDLAVDARSLLEQLSMEEPDTN